MRLGRSSRTPIGIDLGGRAIKAVQLVRSANGWTMDTALVLDRLEPCTPFNADDVRRLGDALYRHGFRGSDAVIAVPGDRQLTAMVELPPAGSGAPREQIARMELSRLHHCEPDTFEMALWDLPKPARASEVSVAMAVACLHSDADDYLEVIEHHGLNALAMDTRVWALVRACEPMIEPGVVVMLDLGWTAAGLALVVDSVVTYERIIPDLGLKQLAERLEEDVGLTPDAIDHVLCKVGLTLAAKGERRGSADELRNAISAHAKCIAAEVRVSLSYAQHRYPSSPIHRVLAAGGGGGVPGLVDLLDEQLDVPVSLATPAETVCCPDRLLGMAAAPILMGALGLAMYPTG